MKTARRRAPSSGGNFAEKMAAFLNQEMVNQNPDIAAAFASVAKLKTFSEKSILMKQGGQCDGVHFIVAGSVGVYINDHRENTRVVNQHVGEQAAIEPFAVRSATVTAVEKTKTLFVENKAFVSICDQFPLLWKPIAITLSRRLRDRSRNIRKPNKVPRLFLASSTEGKPLAQKLKRAIHCESCKVDPWFSKGIFELSRTTIESLERAAENSDFALIVMSPDDLVMKGSKGDLKVAARDNLIFEHGLFSGTLTRERTFFIVPSDADLDLPSDLEGMTYISLKFGPRGRPSDKEINKAAKQVKYAISSLKMRTGYNASKG